MINNTHTITSANGIMSAMPLTPIMAAPTKITASNVITMIVKSII